MPNDNTLLASGDYLSIVRDFAFRRGIGPNILLNQSNVPIEELVNPPHTIRNMLDSGIGTNLYHALKQPINDAVELGALMNTSSHGSLGVAIQCALDVKTGLKIMAEYFNTRLNSQNIILKEKQKYICIALAYKNEDPGLEIDVRNFFDIVTLTSIATSSIKLFNADSLKGEMQIHFTDPEPEDFPHSLMGKKVQALFDQQRIQLYIPQHWMNTPLIVSNPEMSKAALEHCKTELQEISPQDLVSKVNKVFNQTDHSMPTLNGMSNALYMSPATFKRRLKEQNTTYQALKDAHRFMRAKTLIKENTLSLETIADELGFSDASNFSKSFKNWSGLSPKVFRDTQYKNN